MVIKIISRNLEVTDALKKSIEDKLEKLSKFFSSDVVAIATLKVQKNIQTIEVSIPFNGTVLRCEESTDFMYKSIDLVVDKLERQIRKQKTKLEKRNHGDSLRFMEIPDYKEKEEEQKIVRTKKFAIKPMNAEEASLQMELVGHNFFVYLDSDSEKVNVIYKRKDGNFGLIEPEF